MGTWWEEGARNGGGSLAKQQVEELRHQREQLKDRWLSNKESTCQCRRHKRHGFDPWVGKIP